VLFDKRITLYTLHDVLYNYNVHTSLKVSEEFHVLFNLLNISVFENKKVIRQLFYIWNSTIKLFRKYLICKQFSVFVRRIEELQIYKRINKIVLLIYGIVIELKVFN